MNKIKQLIELFESAEKVIKEKTFNIKNKTYNTPKGDVVLEEKSYTLKLLKNDAGSYTITINDKVLIHANKLELKNLTNKDAMK